MPTVTAHTIVRNDERFIAYAIRSVVGHVDRVLVYDTGSTDSTPAVVRALAAEYPDKVVFEEKGPADKARHTRLRQEMLDRTTTEWFLILDGDEVWTRRGIEEATRAIETDSGVDCVIAPHYNCVGDIFHDYVRNASFQVRGVDERLLPRLMRLANGIHWEGDYGQDMLVNAAGRQVHKANRIVLKERFWHLTHLQRSSTDGNVYTSGGSRTDKRRPTYFLIGRRIQEPVPEVFDEAFQRANRVSFWRSFANFASFAADRLIGAKQSTPPRP